MMISLRWMVAAVMFCMGAASSAARAQECAPECRRGYMCVRGQCVSPCNPPCGPGELCLASGECIAQQPPQQTYPQPQPYGQQAYPTTYTAPETFSREDVHTGFHFDLGLGAGFSHTFVQFNSDYASFDPVGYGNAGAILLSASAGYAVARNVILGLAFNGILSAGGKYTTGVAGATSEGDASLHLFHVGPSLRLYTERNLYFDIQAGVGFAAFKVGRDTVDTKVGAGAKLGLGREWFLSDALGLGFGGYVGYTMIPPDDNDSIEAYHVLTVGLGMSFSYR